MTSDEKLVARCLEGDCEAFRELFDRYKAYVFAIILNFVKDGNEAEDIAQEVFLQIYRSLPQCQQENFKSWIGRIAVNKAIDYKRKVARLPCIALEDKAPEMMPVREEECTSPEEIYLTKESREEVRNVTGRLPEIYRRAIEKYYFQDKSCREIAREEGISIKAVESRLNRARTLFKKRWGRDDG
ncbi:MAG: sigma-70 family RNA polymerase sigma factor [Thermosediminibacteraceae bacterium]|nr:sigma-70 family RNA polymerase sigma factor [Thermosediminibacteraceae bacterium]